jgi:hypothetical protein
MMRKVERIKIVCFGIVISIGMISCSKEPTANFTMDKGSYFVGDIVHLTNTSVNGNSWKWTMPNGQILTTQNVDYKLDSNDIGGLENFSLIAEKGSKTSSVFKSVTVSQIILSTDYFETDTNNYNYKPISKFSYVSGNNWVIDAINNNSNHFDIQLQIYFPGTSGPRSNSIFNLVPDPKTMNSGEASIGFNQVIGIEGPWRFDASASGQLYVTIANNGEINASFYNIPSNNRSGVFISGNVTIH